MNNNLTFIDTLKRIARNKGLNKYYKEIGFSKVKNKKYYVITIDNKKINFGFIKWKTIPNIKIKIEEIDLEQDLKNYMINFQMIIINLYFGHKIYYGKNHKIVIENKK